MEFRQFEDGSCDLIFTDQEIKILNKNKKFTMTAEGLKQFSNNLVSIVGLFTLKFSKEVNQQMSQSTSVDLTKDK